MKKMADFFKRMETKFYSDKERENLDKDLDRFFSHPYNQRYKDILARAIDLEKNYLNNDTKVSNSISSDDLIYFATIGLLVLGIGYSLYNYKKNYHV